MIKKPKKKNESKIPTDYIYRAVYQQCPTATKEQVKEVFKAYSEVLNALIDTPNRPKELVVPLPHLGEFYLIQKNGKKAGTKIGGVIQTLYGENKGNRIEDIVVKEDKPDYELLRFKVNTGLQKHIREITSEYIARRKHGEEIEKRFNNE